MRNRDSNWGSGPVVVSRSPGILALLSPVHQPATLLFPGVSQGRGHVISVFAPLPERAAAATGWGTVLKTPPGGAGGRMRGPLLPPVPWWAGTTQVLIPAFLLLGAGRPSASPSPPSASGGSGRARTPLAKWGAGKGSQACLLGRWLAWGWSWYCWAWEGETEGGVGLVSVLPVVSVTCGTSQTYLWMAGPEELVEGPGQLVCPEPAPWGPGQQAVGQVALVHEGLMCEGGTQASPKPLYQPWEAPSPSSLKDGLALGIPRSYPALRSSHPRGYRTMGEGGQLGLGDEEPDDLLSL